MIFEQDRQVSKLSKQSYLGVADGLDDRNFNSVYGRVYAQLAKARQRVGYVGAPVFIGWALHEPTKSWSDFPPAFDGLLPEGVLLEQLLVKHKLDRSDKWGNWLRWDRT